MTQPADRAARLSDLIQAFRSVHLWVLGDIMLDEYVIGEIERISPEAPVPVLRVLDTQYRLGGATNVAKQIATLGVRISLCGKIGVDPVGDTVLSACAESGIDARAVARLEDVPTTRKVRVLGQGQQVVRLDWEDARPCPPAIASEMLDRLRNGPPAQAIVLSDYGKGFLTPATVADVIRTGRERGVPVLVDPHPKNIEVYRGATVLKPNLKELVQVTGISSRSIGTEEIVDAARKLAQRIELEAVVVTLGDRGMLVVPAAGEATEVHAQRRSVFDVTGAGDTAMAVIASALAAGASLVEAADLANLAAGISVGEVGAATVPATELLAAVTGRGSGKVLGLRGLVAQIETWRLQGLRVVFTNGCFDLLHAGHLDLLRQASALGDVLIVAINSDASVGRLKGPDRPLMTQADRAALLAALDCVDGVTVFDEDTPLDVIREVRPDVLVKGGDYRPDEVVGRELVESLGGRVELVPLTPRHSTTRLLERIRGIASDDPADTDSA